jgi:hypothetical protein
MAGFNWGKLNRTLKQKFGGKRKQAAGGKKRGGGKGNTWTAYVTGKKK